MDYDALSDEELYGVLNERAPATAEAIKQVDDSNRQTVIAFLKVFADVKQGEGTTPG